MNALQLIQDILDQTPAMDCGQDGMLDAGSLDDLLDQHGILTFPLLDTLKRIEITGISTVTAVGQPSYEPDEYDEAQVLAPGFTLALS